MAVALVEEGLPSVRTGWVPILRAAGFETRLFHFRCCQSILAGRWDISYQQSEATIFFPSTHRKDCELLTVLAKMRKILSINKLARAYKFKKSSRPAYEQRFDPCSSRVS